MLKIAHFCSQPCDLPTRLRLAGDLQVEYSSLFGKAHARPLLRSPAEVEDTSQVPLSTNGPLENISATNGTHTKRHLPSRARRQRPSRARMAALHIDTVALIDLPGEADVHGLVDLLGCAMSHRSWSARPQRQVVGDAPLPREQARVGHN
jgi:hypothetical protein